MSGGIKMETPFAKKVVAVNIEDPSSRPGWTCQPSQLSPVSLAKA